MSHIVKTLAAVALFVSFTPAARAQLKPEELLKLRQGIMVIQKAQVGAMAAVAKGEAQLSDATAQQAATLATVSRLIPTGFAPDSKSAPGPTKAKPEIWASFDDFKKKADALAAESAKLSEIAKKKDLEGFKAQFAATTAACKACHDTYRAQ